LAEVFVSGFVLACFAAGAAAAALLGFLGYDPAWQVGAFLLVTILVLIFLRPLAARMTQEGGPNTVGIDRVIGQEAVVLVAIDPIAAVGRVRVNREEWQASSADGVPIPAGAVVKVLSVEGTRVRVREDMAGTL
jgi:membrane protein implicated in regulation of membrane protease activity